MITKKPKPGFTSAANYNQQLQAMNPQISNMAAAGAKAVGSILNNNNYRSPSPTFSGAGAYSFTNGLT
jgi:hypothetical protein